MLFEVPDYRPAVISELTHRVLMEFLKFRHFTRYYFELDYAWDKLRYLIKKFNEVHGIVRAEIEAFDHHLMQLAEKGELFQTGLNE
jgi:hypothetical protein